MLPRKLDTGKWRLRPTMGEPVLLPPLLAPAVHSRHRRVYRNDGFG
jgi:hypothetical protein